MKALGALVLGVTAAVVAIYALVPAPGAATREGRAPSAPSAPASPSPEPGQAVARAPGDASAPPSTSASPSPPVVVTPTGVRMVRVPGGEFTMGTARGARDARTAHRVRVSPFWIDVHEVTQASYQALLGENPSRWVGDDQPVEQVRWSDAARYCNARSLKEGLRPAYDPTGWEVDFSADGYRLPTEAEWEYACRAGGDDELCAAGDVRDASEVAWTAENSGGRPHPVGERRPNALGLHDMLGNVWEWCHDRYDPDYYRTSPALDPRGPATGAKRVLRGGGFSSRADEARAWSRGADEPGTNDACFSADSYGFRCVRRP